MIVHPSRAAFAATSGCRNKRTLLQLVLHLVETGIDAVIIDAGRTGNADAADHLSANLDRLPAGYGNDVQSPADAPLNLGLEASWRIRR